MNFKQLRVYSLDLIAIATYSVLFNAISFRLHLLTIELVVPVTKVGILVCSG